MFITEMVFGEVYDFVERLSHVLYHYFDVTQCNLYTR